MKSISSIHENSIIAEQVAASDTTFDERKKPKKKAKDASLATAAASHEVLNTRPRKETDPSNAVDEKDRPYDHKNDAAYFTDRLKTMLVADTKERNRIIGEVRTCAGKLDDGERANSEAHVPERVARLMTINARIDRIEAAQKRMTWGTYGICVETGEPISIGQLIAPL